MIIGKAQSNNVACSPYKLRPLADVIRRKNILYALNWLGSVYVNKRSLPLQKAIYSAVANMLQKEGVSIKSVDASVLSQIEFLDLRIDQGTIRKYFRPGPQGKATILRTRYAHITVVVARNSNQGNKVVDNNKKISILENKKGE